MRLAIMQPYFFPYIGYFQLLYHCDEFVFLNNVNYIKQGWIHRNRMLINDKIDYITLHAHKPSQNKLIKEIKLNTENEWKEKLYKKVYDSYDKKTLYEEFRNTCGILHMTLFHTYSEFLADKATQSIHNVCSYLDFFPQKIHCSSMIDCQGKKGQDRIIHICKELGATEYINPIGGMELYSADKFKENDITLLFLKTTDLDVLSNEEHEKLSILHLMMYYTPEEIKELILRKCKIILEK